MILEFDWASVSFFPIFLKILRSLILIDLYILLKLTYFFLLYVFAPITVPDELKQGGASNGENARQGWHSLINGPVASAGQYLYSQGMNSARSMASTCGTMYKSGQVTSGKIINTVRADIANPDGWVRSGLRVAHAVAPDLVGQHTYKLIKKGADTVYMEWKNKEGMVKEKDQDISTNTSINSSQNHGTVVEERQGSPDGKGLPAPEQCFRDAAGATKEQTPSDLANDNGLVGQHMKENDQDIRVESTNTSINSSQNHGSVGEERQGSPDGGLQAPDHCFRDAAGATIEQTSSDLANDNGLVGRRSKMSRM